MFWNDFMFEYKYMHFFSKTKCTPIFSDFVARYNTLNDSAISLCL